MLERSAEAPHLWRTENTEFAIREQALAADADLVLFQELPRMVPFIETHDMVRANPETHQGNLAILLRHELMAAEGRARGAGDSERHGPSFVAVDGCGLLITLANGLTVANVHLAPGPAAAGERLEQMATIVESSPTPDILVLGDTNTRVDEADAYANAGLTGPKPPTPTWDSRRNRFHQKNPEFSAYFTRWFATERVSVSEVKVWNEPIEHDGHRFHVSDHFALSGRVQILSR